MKNKILMPFFMLGQFDEETTLDLVEMAVRGGADYLELGIPHTDPLADGKLLRETAHKAIAGGMTPRKAIDMVFKIRKKHQDIPHLHPGVSQHPFWIWCRGIYRSG